MSKILLVGDSWGCGEWNPDSEDYYVTHKGLELYLSENHEVVNLSTPAGCNFEAHKKILDMHKNFDYVIWIVTEPDRSFQDYNDFYNKPKLTDEYDGSVDMYTNCVQSHNKIINTIKNACGGKVILIGGLHKLEPGNLYDGFLYKTNWINVLKPNNLKSYYVSNYESNAPLHDTNARQEYHNNMINDKKHFWPDGIHPNRYSHKILHDRLQEEIQWI